MENTPTSESTAQLKDKFSGMLLLGGYGDALGAPHELNRDGGLKGYVGDPETARQLQTFRAYHLESADPWSVWLDPDGVDPDQRGIPTDDTSFRVAILHQWLCELSRKRSTEELSEANFLSWLQSQQLSAEDAPHWQLMRHQQILGWRAMLSDADKLSHCPDDFAPHDDNPFFRKDVPVVFGPFMYLELAAVYAGAPAQEVFARFSRFTQLDQAYGQFLSGMLAAMMAQAMQVKSSDQPFDEWFVETAKTILDSELGGATHREIVRNHFEAASQVGINNRDLSEPEFLERLKTNVFEQPLPRPLDAEHEHLRNFDTLLFLKMMAATVSYSGGDVQKTLRLLAVAPGDCDTMASLLGSIIGARCGEVELRRTDNVLSADLDHVKMSIKTEFAIDVSDIVECLSGLAKRQGYSK